MTSWPHSERGKDKEGAVDGALSVSIGALGVQRPQDALLHSYAHFQVLFLVINMSFGITRNNNKNVKTINYGKENKDEECDDERTWKWLAVVRVVKCICLASDRRQQSRPCRPRRMQPPPTRLAASMSLTFTSQRVCQSGPLLLPSLTDWPPNDVRCRRIVRQRERERERPRCGAFFERSSSPPPKCSSRNCAACSPTSTFLWPVGCLLTFTLPLLLLLPRKSVCRMCAECVSPAADYEWLQEHGKETVKEEERSTPTNSHCQLKEYAFSLAKVCSTPHKGEWE